MTAQETIEIYKTFVDSSLRLTECRHSMNRFNFTLVSGLVVAAWVISSCDIEPMTVVLVWLFAGCCLGAIGNSWKQTICYYRELSSAKFKVIHEMEAALPVQPFTKEWAIVKQNDSCKKNLTKWEEFVPTMLSYIFWPSAIALPIYGLMLFCSPNELAKLFS